MDNARRLGHLHGSGVTAFPEKTKEQRVSSDQTDTLYVYGENVTEVKSWTSMYFVRNSSLENMLATTWFCLPVPTGSHG